VTREDADRRRADRLTLVASLLAADDVNVEEAIRIAERALDQLDDAYAVDLAQAHK
jgi:hypothetical protein